MKPITGILAAAAALTIAAGATPALAGPLDGATVHTEYLFPGTSSTYEDFGDTTVSGNTLLASDAGTTGVDISATGSSILADFSTVQGPAFWTSASFNGFEVFDDTNSASPITSVTIEGLTNMVGFDASCVTFDADHVFVNWQGLSFDNTTKVGLSLNGGGSGVGAVPEAGTWMMMILGFGAIGGMIRRAHRKSEERFTRKVRSIALA